MKPETAEHCYVAATTPEDGPAADATARTWNLPRASASTPPGLRLYVEAHGLRLGDSRPGAPGSIRVDFLEEGFRHRLQQAGAAREPLARAVGARRGKRPRVIDATAGLGQDAAVLAAVGCPVVLVERSPVVAALLADGLRRAGDDPRTATMAERLELVHDDALDYLRRLTTGERPEVVCLDPMYPARRGGARSGRSMQHLQALLGHDPDPSALLEAARAVATGRVVVKRQRRAPALRGPTPDFTCGGSSTRFDIYLCG